MQLALGQALRSIPCDLRDSAVPIAGRANVLPDIGGGNCGIAALVPGDIERGQALLGGPHVIADDRDKLIEHYHLPYTGNVLGPTVVDVCDLTAEYRASGNRCELDTWRHGIDPVYRLANDLVRGVQALQRLTDEFEFLRILQDRILRR